MQSDISASTREFVAKHIVSLEQLEVLLLLHEGKDRDWNPEEVNARLRSQEISITKWLDALVSLGLAARLENRYRFAPATEKLTQETANLAEAYRERRIKIIELIFSKPNENLFDFIRAFEVRKRP